MGSTGVANSYDVDILNKHSGVQILAEAKMGDRISKLSSGGDLAGASIFATSTDAFHYNYVSTDASTGTTTGTYLHNQGVHISTEVGPFTITPPDRAGLIFEFVNQGGAALIQCVTATAGTSPTFYLEANGTIYSTYTVLLLSTLNQSARFVSIGTTMWALLGTTAAYTAGSTASS